MTSSYPEGRQKEFLNILIVDDSESDIEIARLAFESSKIKNKIFSLIEGEEIFDFLEGRGAYQDRQACPRPDLILLDIRMPKIDGITLLKQLKANPTFQTIPVIMLTSSRHEKDVQACYRAGASAYFQKPVIYQNFLQLTDSLNAYWQMSILAH